MKFPVVWSRNAQRAVTHRLAFLLEKGNPAAARRAAQAIHAGVEFVAENPQIGRKMDDMPPGYRRWWVRFGASGYVLLYRVFSDSIVILSVKHGLERDFPGIAAIREQATKPD